MEAISGPTPTPRASVPRALLGPGAPARLTAGRGHTAKPPTAPALLLRRPKGPPAGAVPKAKGLGLTAVITDVPARRKKPAPPTPGPRGPGLIRPLTRKGAARAPPIAVMAPLMALGPRPYSASLAFIGR